jgi:6-phosphogluconolactonase
MGMIRVCEDGQALAEKAATLLIEALASAIRMHGNAVWILAGGSTPGPAYRLLAEKHLHSVNWARVIIGLGDERMVPWDSPESNWRLAEELLLDRLSIPSRQLLRPRTDCSAKEAATAYHKDLELLPKNVQGLPRLDVAWMGVGEDGHTLALFPGHVANDSDNALVAVVNNPFCVPADLISLTYRALRGCAQAVVLAAGSRKADILALAREPTSGLPVARATREIEQAGGEVILLIDRAAAREIGEERPSRPEREKVTADPANRAAKATEQAAEDWPAGAGRRSAPKG